MTDYILEACDLTYIYPDGTEALKGLNIKIPRGKKLSLLGSNGAGKSTLFLHFNGILQPRSGKILYNGTEVRYDRKSLLDLRKNVGIVFQDPDSQLFSASVYQEISFGPLNMGWLEKKVRERVEKVMISTGVSQLRDKPTHMLSYGQKKRVTIADILVMEPQVLISDEPTAWLDPKYTKIMMQLFSKINETGTTVIMSTHDVELAYSWADYVFVMNDGWIIGEGDPATVFGDEIFVHKADLERPWIMDVFETLTKKGLLSATSPVPRNKTELLELISNCDILERKEKTNVFGACGNK
ncbi:MAG: energy-coupling factor ABC transporter ATP-binding protein [Bacillota bacterium]